MPEKKESSSRPAGPRPMWSGTLTFGLVSVPVQLHAANRSAGGASLRMVDEDGTPLSRRYLCPAEDREVPRDELVRGYEVTEGEYVVLTEEELDNLEPKKSREIDLRRFVPVEDLDPVFFQRAYILTPAEGSTKAYRLLAGTMEATGRAGVATFVMRSKEYLVAILAENGILKAETMRFFDEIRTAADVGLPETPEPPKDVLEALVAGIGAASSDDLDREELEDRRSEELDALVTRKRESGEGVKQVPDAARERDEEDEEDSGDVIDLMAVLRRSLAGSSPEADDGDEAAGSGRMPPTRAGRKKAAGGGLEEMTKAQLYERAQALEVSGRSSMTKDELLDAIQDRRRSA